MRLNLFCLVTALVFSFSARATPFQNQRDIVERLGLTPYFASAAPTRLVRIAVLDNGFKGYQEALGHSLPANTVYHAGPIAPPANEEQHGLFMAEIISEALTNGHTSDKFPFELHLYSAFGYSNFAAAIDDVIQKKIDVVLYSQVWEYGGNGFGQGFIDQLVTKAAQSGVIWINAAGNFAQDTFIAPINRGADDWATLPGPNSSVQVRCLTNSTGKCQLRAVLAWNDFQNDVNLGSDKDLDLVLSDDTLKIVQTAGLVQKAKPPADQPGFSKYPREILETELTPGLYFLRVKIRSNNFSPATDWLRLTTSGEFTQLLNQSTGETLLNPADNPLVITVGASDSERSSSSQAAHKPEIKVDSLIILNEQEQYKGSSNSAAEIAAAVSALKSLNPDLTRESFLSLLGQKTGASGAQVNTGQGLPLSVLQFSSPQPNCFPLARLPYLPPALTSLLQKGAFTVQSNRGLKIFVDQDPFTLISGVHRMQADDLLVVDGGGFSLMPRFRQAYLLPNQFEVVQIPQGQTICDLNNQPQHQGGRFQLPPP